MVTRPNGTIIDVNQAFTDILGYTRGEVVGANPKIWQSGRQDKRFYRNLWSALLETGHWRGEIWNRAT